MVTLGTPLVLELFVVIVVALLIAASLVSLVLIGALHVSTL